MSAASLPLRGIRVVNFGSAEWRRGRLRSSLSSAPPWSRSRRRTNSSCTRSRPGAGSTTTYACLNANSRSVKLNLKDETDRTARVEAGRDRRRDD